jgi:hypothetical protein
MDFKDLQLQKCYDSQLVEAGDTSEGLRRVHALIATHDLFQMLEGAHSLRVHETIERLLSAELRPELRRWYQRPGAGTDYGAIDLRNQLNSLVGEQLENTYETPTTQPGRANIQTLPMKEPI